MRHLSTHPAGEGRRGDHCAGGSAIWVGDGRQAVLDIEIAWAVWKDLYSVSSFPDIPPEQG